MPSKRFYIATAPIASINGKMAPIWQKCPNTDEESEIVSEGFWYGYRRKARPDINRYAVRKKGRDLRLHPYTTNEEENRTLFTAALLAVYDHRAIEEDWQLMLNDFCQQHAYKTPIGYAAACCRRNGGEWPPEWSS